MTGPLDSTRKLVVQGNYQLEDGSAVRQDAAPPQNPAPGTPE